MAVLSPSDLCASHAGATARVGGRVSAVHGEHCDLADAFGAVRVAFAATVVVSPGDLIVIEGVYSGTAVTAATLVERASYDEPRGDGDFARFAWGNVGRHLQARARALGAVRAYFAAQDFLEVETPVRVPNPGVDLHLDALTAEAGFLITSPELHMKRLLSGGFPRIFQLAHASRRDEFGTLHEPEFTMLEWYRAFAGLAEMLDDTEQLVREVALAASGRPQLVAPDGRVFDVSRPFSRITVREAFRDHAGISDAADLARSDEARYFDLLVEKVEPGLARHDEPLFLCEYPASQAALARLNPADPSVADRFELYVGGVELCNAFDELTNESEQRRRFELDTRARALAGRPTYPTDERFLAALRAGMPHAGGNALGFDRLLLLACGAREIGEVRAFPNRLL